MDQQQNHLAPPVVLDGLTSSRATKNVITRVSIATCTYAVASSMFIGAFLTATHLTPFGVSPLEMMLLNAMSVFYFAGIMTPVAMVLAWIYRYRHDSPYQQRILDIDLCHKDAVEQALAAASLLPGARLTAVDEQAGTMTWTASRRRSAAPQELTIRAEALSPTQTRLNIASRPIVNALEYLLFGYTLAVDCGRNKKNVDTIVSFFRQPIPITETIKIQCKIANR
jgi:hypothetical protein